MCVTPALQAPGSPKNRTFLAASLQILNLPNGLDVWWSPKACLGFWAEGSDCFLLLIDIYIFLPTFYLVLKVFLLRLHLLGSDESLSSAVLSYLLKNYTCFL